MELFEYQTHLPHPIEAVFGLTVDLENAPHWHSIFSHVQQLTPGAIGPGSRWEVRLLGGRFTLEITDYQPPHRVAFRGSRIWGMVPNFTIELKAADQGTAVRYFLHPEVPRLTKPLVKIFAPPYGRWDLARYFREMEAQLENQARAKKASTIAG